MGFSVFIRGALAVYTVQVHRVGGPEVSGCASRTVIYRVVVVCWLLDSLLKVAGKYRFYNNDDDDDDDNNNNNHKK